LVFTIGHSNHKVEDFIQILNEYEINCICDVRSVPYSRFTDQFNRENINSALLSKNINYIFLGEEFGARREEKNLLTDGMVDFEKVSKDSKFLDGINRIKKGMKKGYKIALMCTEKDPLECHRTILVSRNLSLIGIECVHILPDGSLKKHKEIEQELIEKYFPNRNQICIFDIDEPRDYLSEAYQKANYEIGYRKDGD